MYHTCVFAGLTIYGHSNHKTDITVESMSKNGSWKCITLVCLLDLPYMVTLITKLTSPLNSHPKMVPENVSHLCVCQTYHIWSLWSWNQHHHWIHIQKWFQRCITLVCLLDLPYMVTLIMKPTSLNSHRKMVSDLPYMVATIMKWTTDITIENHYRMHITVPFYKLDDILHI